MKLLGDFFRIKQESESEAGFEYVLSLCKTHFIYGAHFPGNPVTPGACLVQACKELMELRTSAPLFLVRVVNVKFLSVINPQEREEVRFSFSKVSADGETCKCAVLIQGAGGVPFAKLSLAFRRLPNAPLLEERMKETGACVIIPTYNHAPFIGPLLEDVLRYTASVIVVNDGSTDSTPQALAPYANRITLLTLPQNKGKGRALEQGMKEALAQGYSCAITMDSDGQHNAGDLAAFLHAAAARPGAMIIGHRSFREENMPQGNIFANRLSNFWFAVQSGRRLPDTQCGFRLYPLERMKNMRLAGSRYEAELEWLLRLAWKNIPLIPIPVHVNYLPKGQRVSHYKSSPDFFRISLLNALMFFIAILYGYPSLLFRKLLLKS